MGALVFLMGNVEGMDWEHSRDQALVDKMNARAFLENIKNPAEKTRAENLFKKLEEDGGEELLEWYNEERTYGNISIYNYYERVGIRNC